MSLPAVFSFCSFSVGSCRYHSQTIQLLTDMSNAWFACTKFIRNINTFCSQTLKARALIRSFPVDIWPTTAMYQWNSFCWNGALSISAHMIQVCHIFLFFFVFSASLIEPIWPFMDSLWPGDAMWWHGSESALDKVMVCCLTAPSHYLNQCWLIVKGILWHSNNNLTRSAHELNP